MRLNYSIFLLGIGPERKVESHDGAIRSIVATIRELMTPPESKRKKIGFIVREGSAQYRRLSRKVVKK